LPGRWFGEGNQSRKDEFFDLVRQNAAHTPNLIADGLWRRHGEKAFEIVGQQALVDLIPGLGITEQEVRHIATTEQVVRREDLLRRRLPISMARSDEEIAANEALQKLLVELGL